MPIITVWCLKPKEQKRFQKLCRKIVKAVVSVSELELEEKDITVLFPKDHMKKGLEEEIIIDVSGLFEKPDRTPEVCQTLAKKLGQTVAEMFPKSKIECLVHTFNPANGFWTSE